MGSAAAAGPGLCGSKVGKAQRPWGSGSPQAIAQWGEGSGPLNLALRIRSSDRTAEAGMEGQRPGIGRPGAGGLGTAASRLFILSSERLAGPGLCGSKVGKAQRPWGSGSPQAIAQWGEGSGPLNLALRIRSSDRTAEAGMEGQRPGIGRPGAGGLGPCPNNVKGVSWRTP